MRAVPADYAGDLIATRSTLDRIGTDADKAGEIEQVVGQLRQDFKARDDLYKTIENVVFQQTPVIIPDNYRETAIEARAPLALRIVNTITAALSVDPFTVQFEPVMKGQSGRLNSSLREHFFEASWQRQESEAKRRLFRLFMNSLIVKGEAILKTLPKTKRAWGAYDAYGAALKEQLKNRDDPEYGDLVKAGDSDALDRVYDAKTEEYKRGASYPIGTTDVLPETFVYTKGEDGFTLIGEVKYLPYLDALTRYGAKLGRGGRVLRGDDPDIQAIGLPVSEWHREMGKARTLKCVELWQCDCVQYVLYGPGQKAKGRGGTIVKEVPHDYGDPQTHTLHGPYFHALGTTTASRLPERAGLSVLYGYLHLFPLLDNLLTQQGNSAFLTGFAAYKRKGPPGSGLPAGGFGKDGTERETQEKIVPGAIYPWDVEPVEQPRAGVDLDKMIAAVRGIIEDVLPASVRGVISGDESGALLNQATHLARLAWDPIVDNAQFALSDRVGFESWLIENEICERVYAWGKEPAVKKQGQRGSTWLGVGPDELNGAHRYTARLEPATPSNRITTARTLEVLTRNRWIAPEDAMEELGKNPEEVEEAWLVYDLKHDPDILGALRDRIKKNLGTLDQQKLEGRANQETLTAPGAVRPPRSALQAAGLGAQGDVFQAGHTLPLEPTPPGARSGISSVGRAGLRRALPPGRGMARTPGPSGAYTGNPGITPALTGQA